MLRVHIYIYILLLSCVFENWKVFKTLVSSLPTRIYKQLINRHIKHEVLNLKFKLVKKLFFTTNLKLIKSKT